MYCSMEAREKVGCGDKLNAVFAFRADNYFGRSKLRDVEKG